MVKKGGSFPDIAALLAGGFNEETARSLFAQGEEVAIFVMLQLAALALRTGVANEVNESGNVNTINDASNVDVNDIHPSEPSGSVATFLKLPSKKGRARSGVTKAFAVRRLSILLTMSRTLRPVVPIAEAR